jgi:hypothetical protein
MLIGKNNTNSGKNNSIIGKNNARTGKIINQFGNINERKHQDRFINASINCSEPSSTHALLKKAIITVEKDTFRLRKCLFHIESTQLQSDIRKSGRESSRIPILNPYFTAIIKTCNKYPFL